MAKKRERLKLSSVLVFGLVLIPTSVVALSIVTDPRIASKFEFTNECVDDSGNVRAHNDVWTTAGECDRNSCFHQIADHVLGTLRKFLITYRCTDIVDSQNPDNLNCQPVSNTSLTYPACCPVLQCSSASGITTLSPTACYDRSSVLACSYWYNITAGCQSGVDGYNDKYYNYTLQYCRKTCGHCTGSG